MQTSSDSVFYVWLAAMFKPPANRNKKPKPVGPEVAKLDLSPQCPDQVWEADRAGSEAGARILKTL